jgi:hypothetical protein
MTFLHLNEFGLHICEASKGLGYVAEYTTLQSKEKVGSSQKVFFIYKAMELPREIVCA